MVSPGPYVPQRGDVVWITLHHQADREQAGRRPVVVLSPHTFNAKVGLAILCPITSQIKDYPFEVRIPSELPIAGVILSDQIQSMDWRALKAEFVCSLPSEIVTEVLGKLQTLLTVS
jgi:mRNA interferase MazF